MRWSEIYLKTLRDKPAGAETPGHILLWRGGYISPVNSGIFTYNTFFVRSIQKFSNLVREELEKEQAHEILMPMVQPKNLWLETGRWDQFQELLMKMKNHSGQEFCLGPTHEEVVTSFVRSGVNSFRDMPFNIYQIQTKYRDEIRPRFGLLRAREFIMKDAYSFDPNEAGALKSYKKMFRAYSAIFQCLGVKFVVVQADTGVIGGKKSEEFHILADIGEDVLLVSENFAANREICPSLPSLSNPSENSKEEKEVEEISTPEVKTIEALARFLKCEQKELVKILFITFADKHSDEKSQAAVLCKGDDEINLLKAQKILNSQDVPALSSPEDIQKITGASPGSCGPVGLKIPVYVDHKLKNRKNFVTGANKNGVHLKNVNFKDFKVKDYGDFCYAKAGDPNPKNEKQTLKEYRGIEVGHLFYLSDAYSKQMNLKYLDEKGQSLFVEMGCYGLGITRTLQAIVEQSHDKDGIIWPPSVAPFSLHICLIDPDSAAVKKFLDQLTGELDNLGLDYFIDDRKERPGVKFKDADLLGLPLRLNMGERDLKDSQVEIIIRKTGTREKIKLTEVTSKISTLLKELEKYTDRV
ncbi:MAG: proline--tRNA ligase [Bdellovibrionales bacterium]|nr:proline--tRNA ligase [Bdellovibrionales bacterium]